MNERPIAIVNDCRSPVSAVHQVAFDKLAGWFKKPKIGAKDGAGWVPADIEPGPRKAERVKTISFLVLDVEADAEAVKDEAGNPLRDQHGDVIKRVIGPEPPGVDEMLAELALHGWHCFLNTTYSHCGAILPEGVEHPRYRLIFDLSRPLRPDEIKPLGLHVAALLGVADCLDSQCLEPARLFYSPRCPEERLSLYRHGVVAGAPLRVDEVLAAAHRIEVAAKVSPRRTGRSGSVIQAFNAAHTVGQILEQHNYQQKGRKRWLWPDSTTGLPGVRMLPDALPERVYSSHNGDPLADGNVHDAFDCWRILTHGGDLSAAVREAARLMGMERPASASSGAARGNPQPDQGNAPAGDCESPVWPEPKPIQAALKPVPAFDADTLLPEALRGWIMDEADRMPCPPDFIAAGALVALGAIIGAHCAIKPKSRDDWLIVPNLWGGIVALPSAKKSPAIGAAMRPLDRLIARAMETHQANMEAFEADKTVFEAKKEAIESRIKAAAKDPKKGDPESIAKELQSHRQQAPEPPILRRYKSNDTTIEKLGELLRENPAGLLVLRDELVGLIASWDKEGREGERAFYLEAWNGNAGFDTDRIGRGSIFIPNLCVSIFGGIQPDKLTGYLEQAANALANDGMLQRFQVLVYPDHRAWEWRDRIPAKDARDRAFTVFEALADFDPVTWGAAPADDFAKFPYFRFDEAAQAIFIEWSAELHRVKLPAEDEPITVQHLAKFDKLFPALALILHLVDCAATGCRGPVLAESALRAAAWCDYLESHARRCYGLLADDGLRAAQALADKVEQAKLQDGFTARDVRRHQWRYLTTEEAVQAALDWLEDENWLRAEEVGGTGPGTGRRTLRYVINPKLTKAGKSGGDQ